jgi:hypothetical protein
MSRGLKKILRHLPPLSRVYASRCVFASLRARFVYLFVWLVVALSRCVSLSCPLAPPRHVTLRCVVSSCLLSSRHHVLSRRCLSSPRHVSSRRVASRLVASRCAHFVRLVAMSSCCVLTLHPIVTSTCACRCCIASLHRVLSSRRIASRCVVLLPHFVYLVVTLLIPACQSPPLSHDVNVDALVADLLPPQLLPQPNAAAIFNGCPMRLPKCRCHTVPSTNATAASSI